MRRRRPIDDEKAPTPINVLRSRLLPTAAGLGPPRFWALVLLVLGGAIAGNLRSLALSTTVTLLVPLDAHGKANGLVGTVNGVAFVTRRCDAPSIGGARGANIS